MKRGERYFHYSSKDPHNYTLKYLLEDEKQRHLVFKEIPQKEQAYFFQHLPRSIQKRILEKLNSKQISDFLKHLDSDEVTDILQLLPQKKQRETLHKLKKQLKEKVEYLLKFHPKTAAGMMSLDYIAVGSKSTFKKVSLLIKKHEKRTGRFPVILAVEKNSIIGELPVHEFGLYSPSEKITKCIRKIKTIQFNEPQERAIEIFKNHPHHKIVVLDDDSSVLGVIYADDIIHLMRNESSDQLYDFAGVSDEETSLDSVGKKVKLRYKWLIVNLLTTILAAFVVSLFQETISTFVILAVFMPIVAGMGGNAGTQTLAVTIRGITTQEISIKNAIPVIRRETIAGALNGALIGLIITTLAFLTGQTPLFGLIAMVSMMSTLVIAGFAGSLIPIILDRLGKDPATSATVFITTATDLFGFFIFLGLASILL